MEIKFPEIYFPGKKEMDRLGFEHRHEHYPLECYELWIPDAKMFLVFRVHEKHWTIGQLRCYPRNELELKVFIRTMIAPEAISVK